MTLTQELWDRFEAQLAARVPRLRACMRPPATPTEIEATEIELGLSFPDEVRFAYLRHNGSSADEGCPCFFVPGGADWLSLRDLREHWRTHRDIHAELTHESERGGPEVAAHQGLVRNEFWNPKRLPIGRAWGGRHLFVDLWPGSAGVQGQLVVDDGMSDFSTESVVATSLDAYLTKFTDRLAQGLVRFEPGRSWINAKTGESVIDWRTLAAP